MFKHEIVQPDFPNRGENGIRVRQQGTHNLKNEEAVTDDRVRRLEHAPRREEA